MDTQEIMHFLNDEPSIETIRVDDATPISIMAKDTSNQDITNYLQRPYKIGTYVVDESDQSGKVVFKYNINDILATRNVSAKMDGFRYLRGGFEMNLYANMQPFQAGCFLLYYVCYSESNEQWSQAETLTGQTGMPSVVMNLEDATPARLVVPFNHPHGYLDIKDPVGDMGTFVLVVYSPLITGVAQTSIDISAYIKFVEPEYFGLTGDTVAPSGIRKQMAGVDEAEVAESKGLLATVRESKIVSKGAQLVSDIAGEVGEIPFLAPIAKPVSWIAAAIAKTASFFGWSKPINVKYPEPFFDAPYRYTNNYNAVDNGENIGLDLNNQVQDMTFFGKHDQLSFDAITTNFNFITRFIWNEDRVAGDILYQVDIEPMMGRRATSLTVGDDECQVIDRCTHMAFVAEFFRFWRGSVKLNFRAIKTCFHSGRLQFIYQPGLTQRGFDLNSTMAYSIIWDLKENNTTCVEIPYMSPKPWLEVLTPAQAFGEVPRRFVQWKVVCACVE